jgi:hypothetical protein
MPVGPKTLCPEKTNQSLSSACTSVRMCETDCAPSTRTRARGVRHGGDLRAGRDGPQRVRNLRKRNQLRFRPKQLRVFVEQNLPVSSTGNHAQRAPFLGGQLLPRHDVGVVLQPADTISSSLPMFWRPQLCATRLIASVAPRTNTISLASARSETGAPSLARLRKRRWRAPPVRARRDGCSSSRARRSTSAVRSRPAASAWWPRCPARPAGGRSPLFENRKIAPDQRNIETSGRCGRHNRRCKQMLQSWHADSGRAHYRKVRKARHIPHQRVQRRLLRKPGVGKRTRPASAAAQAAPARSQAPRRRTGWPSRPAFPHRAGRRQTTPS